MDFRGGIGSLKCRLCAASYQMPIHHLHEPVDVFSEWLDDCEQAAKGGGGGAGAAAEAPRYNDEEESDEDDTAGMEYNGGKKNAASSASSANRKRPAQDMASRKKQKVAPEKTFTDLGLDDSDSDSDED